MKRAVRAQRRALDQLLRRRAAAAKTGSPEEYLRRMPVRDGPPCPPLNAADDHILRRFRRRAKRWFIPDSAIVPAHAAGEHDLTLLVGSPPQVLAAIDRVEHATCRAVRDVWPSFRGMAVGGVDIAPFSEPLRLRAGPGIVRIDVIQPVAGVTLAIDGRVVIEKRAYFEFIPQAGGDACGLAHIHDGRIYRVLVSAGEEMWRQDGGELVRFDSGRIERVGNRFELGSFGERLLQEQLEGVRGTAAAFRLNPEYPTAMEPVGRYAIEAEYHSVPADLAQEARRVDAALMDANESYRWLREQAVLRPPVLQGSLALRGQSFAGPACAYYLPTSPPSVTATTLGSTKLRQRCRTVVTAPPATSVARLPPRIQVLTSRCARWRLAVTCGVRPQWIAPTGSHSAALLPHPRACK